MPPNPDFFRHVPVPSGPDRRDAPHDRVTVRALQVQPQVESAGSFRNPVHVLSCAAREVPDAPFAANTSPAAGAGGNSGHDRCCDAADRGDDRPLVGRDTSGGAGRAARGDGAAARSPDSSRPPVAAELRRTARVLAAMERVLAGVQPTDPPEMVAYWGQVRDRAAREAEAANSNHHWSRGDLLMLAEQGFPLTDAEAVLCAPSSVADALGGGWFREEVQS